MEAQGATAELVEYLQVPRLPCAGVKVGKGLRIDRFRSGLGREVQSATGILLPPESNGLAKWLCTGSIHSR